MSKIIPVFYTSVVLAAHISRSAVFVFFTRLGAVAVVRVGCAIAVIVIVVTVIRA